MFVILTYDVEEKRVGKILNICRKYLYWVQNSVFEGNIETAKLNDLVDKLENTIDEEYDSINIYTMNYNNINKKYIGVKKGGEELIY